MGFPWEREPNINAPRDRDRARRIDAAERAFDGAVKDYLRPGASERARSRYRDIAKEAVRRLREENALTRTMAQFPQPPQRGKR